MKPRHFRLFNLLVLATVSCLSAQQTLANPADSASSITSPASAIQALISPRDRAAGIAASAESQVGSLGLQLYDDFNNIAYDGSYNPTLWTYAGENFFQVRQANGSLVFSNATAPSSGDSNLVLSQPHQRSLLQLQQFEARLKISSNSVSAGAMVKIQVISNNVNGHGWWTQCSLWSSDGSYPDFTCDLYTYSGGNYYNEYVTSVVGISFDNWYTVRIEADPGTADLKYYLNGTLVGSHVPADAAALTTATNLEPRVGAWNNWADTYATRYVDDVRITGGSFGKKPVVVLLHGWLGASIPPHQTTCGDGITQYNPDDPNHHNNQNFDSDTEHLAQWLWDDSNYGEKFELWSAHIDSGTWHTASLRDNAICLKDELVQVASHAPDGKVILIAHSMGGVVARAYIEDRDLYQYNKNVKTLITLGSPHLGVSAEVIEAELSLLQPAVGNSLSNTLNVYCISQPAVCEFTTEGMKTTFNRQHAVPTRDEVTYHLISGAASFFSRNAKGKAMAALVRGPNDGIIQTGSGLGKGLDWTFGYVLPIPALWGVLDRLQTDENHNVFGTNSYFNRDTPYPSWSDSYRDCIRKLVVEGQANCGTVSALESAAQTEPALAQHTPMDVGLLLPGQTATRTVALEGGPALFAAQWQTGTVTVTLHTPGDQLVDAAYAAAYPAVVSYTVDANAATYYFPTAMKGAWQLGVQAGADMPLTGTAYSTFAAFDSSVALVGGNSQPWYAPGATATFTAALSGTPASAAITATVFRADGVTDTVALADLGGGQYLGAYLVPNIPGYTEVRWLATGVTTNSLPFERMVSGIFQISPNSLALTGNYGETVQRRLPAWPFYQTLTVTVGVTAAVSGTFGVSADLVDGAGNVVAHSLTVQDLLTGTTAIALNFAGDGIYAAGRDGPYHLTHLLLTDQRAATLAVAEAQDVYTTAAYRYIDFAIPQFVYLPLMRR